MSENPPPFLASNGSWGQVKGGRLNHFGRFDTDGRFLERVAICGAGNLRAATQWSSPYKACGKCVDHD